MTYKIPEQPENSFRITLELSTPEPRLDTILLTALRNQREDENLSLISKRELKDLFANKKVFIKGQSAKAKSRISDGITYIDILL